MILCTYVHTFFLGVQISAIAVKAAGWVSDVVACTVSDVVACTVSDVVACTVSAVVACTVIRDQRRVLRAYV